MRLGITLRNWGAPSTRETMRECAEIADASALHSLWVNDHLALPPGEEGDGDEHEGRVLEPLTTLAWLAAVTERIELGTGVLVLPYRPPLLLAKTVASVQELAGGRLRLGIGVGWMAEEFRALGVERTERGRLTDAALEFLHACFAADHAEANGQPFLFRPRPPRPQLLVGGAPPRALTRAARLGDAWMPAGWEPGRIEAALPALREAAAESGRDTVPIVAMKTLPLEDVPAARQMARDYAALGVAELIHAEGYADTGEYERRARLLEREVLPALARE